MVNKQNRFKGPVTGMLMFGTQEKGMHVPDAGNSEGNLLQLLKQIVT